jgi:hypothetical protein
MIKNKIKMPGMALSQAKQEELIISKGIAATPAPKVQVIDDTDFEMKTFNLKFFNGELEQIKEILSRNQVRSTATGKMKNSMPIHDYLVQAIRKQIEKDKKVK